MKLFQTLFMFLILMTGFTALATTPMLEQKQKLIFEMVQAVTKIENVEVLTQTVFINSVRENQKNLFYLKNVNEPETPLEIITDVGWQGLEKLNIKNKKNFSVANHSIIRIRNDSK